MKITKTLVMATMVLSCAACAFDVPSQLESSRIEIVEGLSSQSYDTKSLDQNTIKKIAQDYSSSGHGVLELTVTYDPKSKSNTAMKATLEAGRIAQLMTDQGVSAVSTKVLPIADSWKISHALVSYTTLSAEAPSVCDRLPGFESHADVGDVSLHKEYGYGCTIEAMIAEQIAHPEDLLGQSDKTRTESGRRAENVVEGRGYYGYSQSPTLGGESSSN
ncbi:MAG: hypothetical protein JKY11_07965 [Alphaproteobacteria bacterium]|nr:hypothetical protein [Alphaproteobacteria bacterium]